MPASAQCIVEDASAIEAKLIPVGASKHFEVGKGRKNAKTLSWSLDDLCVVSLSIGVRWFDSVRWSC